MTTLELVPAGAKFVANLLRDSARVWTDQFNPDTVRGRKATREKAGVTDEQLVLWIDEARKEGRPRTFTFASPDSVAASKPVARTRRSDETATVATEHDLSDPSRFVKDVLAKLDVTTLAEWDDKAVLCCLDVDYHDRKPPDKVWLETVVYAHVAPKPFAWHVSRGGGLHLFYVACPPFTAEELAAVAALRFRTVDPTAGLELKAVVFGPGAAEWHQATGQDAATTFVSWLGTEDFAEAARDEWLEKEGMAIGGRYDHTRCPISPTPGHASKGDPVLVGERGVHCFRCEGEGVLFGTRRPGWAPWSAVLGCPSSGDLGAMVRNVTHWGHARWVLTEKYGLRESFARLAYTAALKAYHAGRPTEQLLPYAFNQWTDGIARVNNQWMTVADSFEYPLEIQPMLAKLPVCMYVGDDGKIKSDPAAVCEMKNLKNHAARGYPPLNVVHGFKMTGPFLTDARSGTTIAAPNPKLPPRCRPKYVPVSRRMPEEEAWAVLESVAPRVDRTLVRAAIVAFASAQETRAGLLPVVFVSGPTGSAKTATLKLAAGIYGGGTHDVVFEPEPAKFRQSVRHGAQTSSAVIFNEILKESSRGRNRLSHREALDPILNLTEDSASWVAYVGTAKLGRPPAVFLTEPVCPIDLRDETQLARRIRTWKLHGEKKEWPKTLAAAGLGADLHMLRTVSEKVNEACDAVLSAVCDEFFGVLTTWDEAADRLGVRTIRESPEFEDSTPWLREFFRLVCLLPALTGRYKGVYHQAYKRINRSEGITKDSLEDKLVTVYSMFSDGAGSDWVRSRKLEEKDWSGVLGVADPVSIDLLTDRSSVFVRFRVGPVRGPGAKFNEQIVDPHSLEALL